jgi:hypothetical protein
VTYFRPSQERPRVAKRFLTAREVEDMAAAGASEIALTEGLVITDAAREAAHDLGLRIAKPDQQAQPKNKPPERAAEPAATAKAPEPGVSVSAVLRPAGSLAVRKPFSGGVEHGSARFRGKIAGDALLQSLVKAVRSNPENLAAIAEGRVKNVQPI